MFGGRNSAPGANQPATDIRDRPMDGHSDEASSAAEETFGATEPITLKGVFTSQVTVSGSFHVRDGVWATTLGQIIQAVPVPALLVDSRNVIIGANDACSRIGLAAEILNGSAFPRLFRGPASQGKCEEFLSRVFQSRAPVVWEARLAGADREYWARTTLRSVRIGKDRFCLALIEDLTREKALLEREAALCRDLERLVSERTEELRGANIRLMDEVNQRKASEEKYRNMVEAIEEGYYELDTQGKVIFCNSALGRLMGRTADELVGSLWSDHAAGAAEAMLSSSRAAREGRSGPVMFAFDLSDEQGFRRFIEASTHAISTPSGDISGFRGVCRDITERKRREALETQAERHRAVADLAAGVAHNFNNLLQVVMGCAELATLDLRAGALANVARNLDQIMKSCRFAAETVRKLQSFVGLTDAANGAARKVFDLAELVSRAVDITRAALDGKGEGAPDVRFHLNIGSGCYVFGIKAELFEAVSSLVQNAAEAVAEKGHVTVNLEAEDKTVTLRITDTGTGIGSEHLGRLFNPFFTTKFESGAGLGLATSAKIVQRHSGRILVDSTPGSGSTFTLELPLAEPQPTG
jgi:PAS domain S-box-containing protein